MYFKKEERASIRKAAYGEEQPFLSAGYMWADKPHKSILYAMDDIEELESKLNNAEELLRKHHNLCFLRETEELLGKDSLK